MESKDCLKSKCGFAVEAAMSSSLLSQSGNYKMHTGFISVPLKHTPLLSKRDCHQDVGDVSNLFLELQGVPFSNFFYLAVAG